MLKFLLGIVVAVVVVVTAGFCYVRFGFVDARADLPVDWLESKIAMPALDAAVDRRAPETHNPIQPTDANLVAGMKIYQSNCAGCHGDIQHSHAEFGDGFYPRAPQFVEDAPDMPENQNLYIIQHGIRLSGMPAWKKTLSEQETWQVTGFLSHMDKLSPQVSADWKKAADMVGVSSAPDASTSEQAQELLNAASQATPCGRRDAAVIGLLLGCGPRRSETVKLRLDQLQLRESHWVIVDMVGKGGRLRTIPMPAWCKGLIDAWVRETGVTEGKVFRRVSKTGTRQGEGVTTDVVWYAVKRYAKRIGIYHLAPHDLRRTCARLCLEAGGELEQIQLLLGHASVQTTERYIGCRQNLREAVNDRFRISPSNRMFTESTAVA